MARYAIYDNESSVLTPIGEELTAEMWLNRYPWGRKTKMVVGGGVINGCVAFIFDDFVAEMRRQGCDFAVLRTSSIWMPLRNSRIPLLWKLSAIRPVWQMLWRTWWCFRCPM